MKIWKIAQNVLIGLAIVTTLFALSEGMNQYNYIKVNKFIKNFNTLNKNPIHYSFTFYFYDFMLLI
jgi:hypothetical protein